MSVLVRDMKIPKNCMDCPLFESLYHFHGCHAKPESFKDRDMWNFAVSDRPSWCPLAEVPVPHGKLIDADELKAYWQPDHDREFCADYFIHTLEVASTVIEAEDGEA